LAIFPVVNKKVYPKRPCGCAGKGGHKATCITRQQIQASPITQQPIGTLPALGTVPTPQIQQVQPAIEQSTGLTFGGVVEQLVVYPEGYKAVVDGKVVLIMVNQQKESPYTAEFREVVENTIDAKSWYSTHAQDDNWLVILPKLWLEATNKGIPYIKVTIEATNSLIPTS